VALDAIANDPYRRHNAYAFLRGHIPFTDIAGLLRRGADLGARAKRSREPGLDEIVAIDASVRASLGTPAAVA